MTQGEKGAETLRGIDVLLTRVFYIEAILFMASVMLLGVYLYPTIMRFVDLSFRLEKLGDIGAFVDEQVARVEGQLKGVTERVEARVDELGGKLEGVSGRLNGQLNNIDKRVAGITSRLDGQITNVEERLDNMFETIEEKLRSLFKLKLGQTDGAMD